MRSVVYLSLCCAVLGLPGVARAQVTTSIDEPKAFYGQAEIYQSIDRVWHIAKDQTSWPTLLPELFGPNAARLEVDIERDAPNHAVFVQSVDGQPSTLVIRLELRWISETTTVATCKLLHRGNDGVTATEEELATTLLRNLARASHLSSNAVYATPIGGQRVIPLGASLDSGPPRRPSYAKYMGIAEGLSWGSGLVLTLASMGASSRSTQLALALTPPLLTSISVPVVHLARGHADRALASLFLRGAAWGLGLGLPAWGVGGCKTDSCVTATFIGGVFLLAAGLTTAIVIDYAVLSKEDAKPASVSFVVMPNAGGAMTGLVGQF